MSKQVVPGEEQKTNEPMSKEKYLQTQLAIFQIARILATVDVDTFVSRIEQAENSKPEVAPEIFAKAQANLKAVKELAQSLRPAKEVHSRLFKALFNQTLAANVKQVVKPAQPMGHGQE